MAESAKRHEENSNIIKEIRASTDASIRNQGASIKTLEIHIGQMSKVLQERGFGSLPSSTETNPRDHVKSISTAKADLTGIRHIGSGPYAVSSSQFSDLFSEIVPFPKRLHGYCCDDWKEARELKILETYDHTLPHKEKDPGSFTLPCFIHNVCFDKALDAIRCILGFGIRRIDYRYRPCCNKIDELVMVYSGKRRVLNSYSHSDASSTHFCSRTQIGESSRAKYQGSSSF
ncbi:hypothetical protein Tco_1076494 [Tanacetum coccineum]